MRLSIVERARTKTPRAIVPIVVDANDFVKLKRHDRALYENIEKGIVLWQAE